jgi:hypothetical protein
VKIREKHVKNVLMLLQCCLVQKVSTTKQSTYTPHCELKALQVVYQFINLKPFAIKVADFVYRLKFLAHWRERTVKHKREQGCKKKELSASGEHWQRSRAWPTLVPLHAQCGRGQKGFSV